MNSDIYNLFQDQPIGYEKVKAMESTVLFWRPLFSLKYLVTSVCLLTKIIPLWTVPKAIWFPDEATQNTSLSLKKFLGAC